MANFATKVAWMSSKWAILVKFQQELKYLSGILTDLHRIFRTGLVFLSWSKWVQGMSCYDQNWWKLKYLSRISIDLHQTFRKSFHFSMGIGQNEPIFGVLQLFQIISHQKWGSEWLIMANFTRISTTFPIFYSKVSQFWLNISTKMLISAESGGGVEPSEQGRFFWASQNESKECYAMNQKWLDGSKLANISAELTINFQQNEAQNDLQWLNLTWSASNFSHLLPPGVCAFKTEKSQNLMQNLDGEWGYIGNIFWVFQHLWNHFILKQVKVTHNGKFCQKSGLDWLQMANFGHFAGFSIFSPKMRLRLTWNGQFHPIHNFPHLLPPKCLIFGEISKVFVLRGIHQQIFWVSQLFQIVSHQRGSKWPTMANFAKKVA